MTLDDLNKIINEALADVAHGQLVNATALRGKEQEERLSESFDMLIRLEESARKVAATKFK